MFSAEEKLKITETKNAYYQELIVGMNPSNVLPGVLKVFESLRQKGIKIGLASASKNALQVIVRLGITGYFDFIARGNAAQV